jgi:hypothetical protein
MAIQVYILGQNHLLKMALQGVAFAGPFYLGLGTGNLPANTDTTTMSDVTEVTGTGYARQPVNRSALAAGWAVTDNEAESPTVTFTNSDVDPDVVWTDIDYMFLTLSPSGTTAPNILYAAVELEDTITLSGGISQDFIFNFALQS